MNDSTRRCARVDGPPAGRRRGIQTLLRDLIALCGLVVLTSCGDGSDGNPTSPTPTTPAPRLLQQGDLALRAPTADSFYFALTTIADAGPGRWEATVDWAREANTLWMWVADGACTVDQFARADCPFEATCPCRFAVRSEAASPKPRVLSIPGAAGGMRTLIVANLGPSEETAQYRVTLTSGGIATSARTGAAATDAGSGVSIGRHPALRRR